MSMTAEPFMARAILAAEHGLAAGQTPFGAVIVRENEVVAAEHNAVWAACDPTAHAEVRAIRSACEALRTIDLGDCEIFSTCEPCPMCFTAIHWAKLPRLTFGASIADAAAAGFGELDISNEQMKSMGASDMEIIAGLCRDRCVALFTQWLARDDRREY
ncbi:MAG: nucleoside deaminase [Planctomycetes bacterium]|jgi:tRNA(Arg) A34 adenosine deaminase TadA|nr:nucleoside deaminase [Planctomycetota bacterium]